MIRFSRNFFFNPAQIFIFGIKCTFNNIVKICDVFDYKWIVVTIDSVKKGSSLFTFIKTNELKYFERQCLDDYVEISVVIPCTLFEFFLERAINEDPENIFVINILDYTNIVMCLEHSFEELIIMGISDIFISICFDENGLLICVNKYSISPKIVFNKIKELRFE